MKPTPYAPRYREPVVVDVPETVAEAEAPLRCPVFRCTLAGRGCAARHLSGVAGHPSHATCATCPAGKARAALLDVRAPTPADVLRQMTHPGGVPVFEERYMSDATDKILAHLAGGPATAGDIRRATGLGDSTVKSAVQTLKSHGRVTLAGHGKTARWSLASGPAEGLADLPPAVEERVEVEASPEVDALRARVAYMEAERDALLAERDALLARAETAQRTCTALTGRVLVAIGQEHLLIDGPVSVDTLVAEVERVMGELRQEAASARRQRDTALSLRETYNIPNDYKTALAHMGRALEAVGKALAAMNGGNHE